MISGDYMVPTLDNRIYTAKPPLFNWLIIAASLPQGEITEFSARLPSVICLALLSVIMVLGMRRFLKLEGLIFLGLSIILSIELMSKAQLAEIEMVFTFLVTLSLWSWYWLNKSNPDGILQWLLSLVLVALAFLAKGPPAIIFFYLGVIPFLIVKKRWRELFSFRHFIGFLGMSLIISGWVAMMIRSTGIQLLLDTLNKEMLSRGKSGSPLDYIEHLLSYPFELFAAMLPFSLLMIPLFSRSIRKIIHSRYGDIYTFTMLTLLANLPIYWFSSKASVRYFMPLFPTALVLSALVFEIYMTRVSGLSTRFSEVMKRSVKIGAIILIICCLALTASPLLGLWENAPPMIIPWFFTLALGIAVLTVSVYVYRLTINDPRKMLLPVIAGIMIVARLIYFCDVLPVKAEKLRKNRNAHALMETLKIGVGDSKEQIKVIGWVPYDIWFYDKNGLLSQYSGSEVTDKGYFMGYEDELKSLKSYQVLKRIFYKRQFLVLGMFNPTVKQSSTLIEEKAR